MLQLGIDVGGTFTDFVLLREDGTYEVTKVSSDHRDPTMTISAGIGKLNLDLTQVANIFYGSTVAVNALIHGEGARSILLTTKGFRDIYAIGRLSKQDMYNLLEKKHPLLVDRARTIEINERVTAEGSVDLPVVAEEVIAKVRALREFYDINSAAVCFLNSYANQENELHAEKILRDAFPDLYVTTSANLVPQWHEFERTCTTVLNAFITPVTVEHMQKVAQLFDQRGFRGSFFVMQSNGSVSHVDVCTHRALATLNSGPAAGVIGGVALAKQLGHENILTVDMGGTSFDVGICDRGSIRVSIETTTLKHPTLLPSIDIYSIGAGGGSIAWIDDGGALQVGPRSAEADPGPVFYDKGGTEPTVSDANLIAGRLNSGYLLGGELKANRERAAQVLSDRIAQPFGWSEEEAASSILEIVDNKMAYAIRSMTIEKGLDPADFVMVAFGGAGALHASAIAGLINIPVVIIPQVPGNFSAFGMLATDVKHDFVRTFVAQADDPIQIEGVNQLFGELKAEAQSVLDAEHTPEDSREYLFSVDARYMRQEHTLTLSIPASAYTVETAEALRHTMDRRHTEEYGFCLPDEAVQLTNLRVTAVGRRDAPRAQKDPVRSARGSFDEASKGTRTVLFGRRDWVECPIYERACLPPNQELQGPAIIEEALSTTVVLPGDRVLIDSLGNIIIRKEG